MTIDLPPWNVSVRDPNGVLGVLVPTLITSMFAQAEFLLRRPRYSPIRSDVAVLTMLDHEQRITDVIVQIGDIPGEMRTVHPAPLSKLVQLSAEPDVPAYLEPTYNLRRWLPSMWASAFVAAHLLPGVPHDDAYQVRVTAALYEPEGAAR